MKTTPVTTSDPRGSAQGTVDEPDRAEPSEPIITIAEDTPFGQPARSVLWPWVIVALVSTAVFLDTLDTSVVNVTLPSIQRDLHLATTSVQWIPGAYVLTNAGLQLLGGRAADLLGRRRIFLLGTTIFGLASLAGGLAPTGGLLILARGVQGIGAACTLPAGVSIITTTFTGQRERARAFGIFSAMAAVGFACGIIAGGLLTTFVGWHGVFFVNVPVTLLIVLFARIVVPEHRPAIRVPSYDLAGAITATGGLLLFAYAVTQANDSGATLARTAALLLLAFLLLAIFIGIEQRSTTPLMPLRLFRASTLRAANGSFFLLLGSFSGFLFLYTFAVQGVLHYSPLDASLALLPAGLINIPFSRYVSPWVINRWGMQRCAGFGLVCLMSGIALFTRLGTTNDYWGIILPSLVLANIGMSLGHPSLSLAGISGIEPTDQGIAAGVLGAVGAAGGGLGIAIATSVATASMAASRGSTTATTLLSGVHAGFIIAATGAALGAVLVFVGMRQRSAAV